MLGCGPAIPFGTPQQVLGVRDPLLKPLQCLFLVGQVLLAQDQQIIFTDSSRVE